MKLWCNYCSFVWRTETLKPRRADSRGVHEPGPPRTTSVGESVELAARSPDADGTYRWRVRDAPADSDLAAGDGPDPDATGPPSSATATGGDAALDPGDGPVLRAGETVRDDDPVVHLAPDAPGTYVLALDAPDGTHRQRVRAFRDERQETEIRVPAADVATDGDTDRVSLLWPHNENRLALDRAERAGVPTVEAIRLGVPHRVIREYAEEEGVDLVVMGTHGRTGIEHALVGSVTERVVRTLDVPVLTVHPGSA